MGKSEKSEKIVVVVDGDIEDLVPEFLVNRGKDIEEIFQALEVGDYESIRLTGHGMKGSGGGYGFDRISELGHIIESGALNQEKEKIEEAVRSLGDFLERVVVRYEERD